MLTYIMIPSHHQVCFVGGVPGQSDASQSEEVEYRRRFFLEWRSDGPKNTVGIGQVWYYLFLKVQSFSSFIMNGAGFAVCG